MSVRVPDFSWNVGIEGVAPPRTEAILPAKAGVLPGAAPAAGLQRFSLLDAPSTWDALLHDFVTPEDMDRQLLLPGELAARLRKASLLTRDAHSPHLRALRHMLEDSAALEDLLQRGCSLLLRG